MARAKSVRGPGPGGASMGATTIARSRQWPVAAPASGSEEKGRPSRGLSLPPRLEAAGHLTAGRRRPPAVSSCEDGLSATVRVSTNHFGASRLTQPSKAPQSSPEVHFAPTVTEPLLSAALPRTLGDASAPCLAFTSTRSSWLLRANRFERQLNSRRPCSTFRHWLGESSRGSTRRRARPEPSGRSGDARPRKSEMHLACSCGNRRGGTSGRGGWESCGRK